MSTQKKKNSYASRKGQKIKRRTEKKLRSDKRKEEKNNKK